MSSRTKTIVIPRGFDLAGLRTTRNMTLAELWKRSKIPYSKLARIEHGEAVELTGDEVTRLARACKVSESAFTKVRAAMLVDREVWSDQRRVGRRQIEDERRERVERTVQRLSASAR